MTDIPIPDPCPEKGCHLWKNHKGQHWDGRCLMCRKRHPDGTMASTRCAVVKDRITPTGVKSDD